MWRRIPTLMHRRPVVSATLAASAALGTGYLLYSQREALRARNPFALLGATPRAVHADAEAKPESPNAVNDRPLPFWSPPSRCEMLNMLQGKTKEGQALARPEDEEFDLLVIGGGATGTGVALDAATRGLRVALVERDDFSAGTSSRSTKLVHGGVRYLEKAVWELDIGQYYLVKEALHERKTFLDIAPYLSQHLPIMIPVYKWWQMPYFWAGCKAYDLLAGSQGLESSYLLTRGKAIDAFPMLKKDQLKGALVYYDGQHNDSRMNVAIALTAISHGAVVTNHTEVTSLIKEKGADGAPEAVRGAVVRDALTGEEFTVRAKGVINATGPFSDAILNMDNPQAKDIVAPSSGVHIILPKYYSPDNMGLIDPNTSDGRVIFFLPWQGHTIAGTTDSPAPVEANPIPKEEEIQWILDEVRGYLDSDIKVRRGDVLAAWSGIRPLVRDPAAKNTAALVRSHMINVSPGKLLTIAGGKWTTYRNMAEETVDRAIQEYGLHPTNGCVTSTTKLIGSHNYTENMFIKLVQSFGLETPVARHLAQDYGDRAWAVCAMAEPTGKRFPIFGRRLSQLHPYIEAEVRYAVKNEYACTAVDVLARRTRLAFVNAQAAKDAIPEVVDIMAKELGWDAARIEKEKRDTVEFLHAMGLPTAEDSSSPLPPDGRRLVAALTGNDDAKAESSNRTANPFASYAPMYEEISMRYNQGQFHPDELGRFIAAFEEHDRRSAGEITRADLKPILAGLGIEINSAQQSSIESQFKLSQANRIGFEQFLDILGFIKESQYAASKPVDQKRIPISRSGGGV
ncbi:mitochondrial glycerol-3-phosphate dehydrogenase [Tieghemiomyces parasiticus]|uniref:Glycerol-3-phosphate dehydrogenase n=1 Tax=Tieghemiomyces parasiticus TaxID=78921 RepID=A0A9W8AGG3_9FUNG|nr:mitochondrial glycerol-3-phosphate dehydrogenase [Tieghemiomyces parasiticus]